MERYTLQPGDWQVTVNEVSSGVYEILAVSPSAGELRVTTTDPDAGLQECQAEALERTAAGRQSHAKDA
jgi:hypothetical protein